MSITAAMVKELREKSGAGMMDCKTALNESGGDMEAAVDWLRTKGLAKAAKKAGRVAAEGLVGVASDGGKAAVIELNSEQTSLRATKAFRSWFPRSPKLRSEPTVLLKQYRQPILMANLYLMQSRTQSRPSART